MRLPAICRSLSTTVFTNRWPSVVAGVAVMVVSLSLGVGTDTPVLLVAGAGIGGFVAGSSVGKHWKATTGIGFRVGFIGAIAAMCLGLLLMEGDIWTLEYGSGDLGVVEKPVTQPGTETSDVGESPTPGFIGEEISDATSMSFLVLFTVIFIPASVVLAMGGCAVGTTVRRAILPDRYNPPLF